MTTETPRPMDPDRRAELEHEASLMRVSMIPQSVLHVSRLIYEALADAKYWQHRAVGAERDRDSAAAALAEQRIEARWDQATVGPMRPEARAHVRRMIESNPCGLTTDQARDLLAHADYIEQQLCRLLSLIHQDGGRSARDRPIDVAVTDAISLVRVWMDAPVQAYPVEIPEPAAMDAGDLAGLRASLVQGWLRTQPTGWAERFAALIADRDWHAQRAAAAEATPMLFSTRQAMRDAGVPDSEMGLSAAEAIRFLARQRDAAMAEVARLRAGKRVDADDVEVAGATRAHVETWLRANGYKPRPNPRPEFDVQLWLVPGWQRLGTPEAEIATDSTAYLNASAIRAVASILGRNDWDILAEMAAMEIPT